MCIRMRIRIRMCMCIRIRIRIRGARAGRRAPGCAGRLARTTGVCEQKHSSGEEDTLKY